MIVPRVDKSPLIAKVETFRDQLQRARCSRGEHQPIFRRAGAKVPQHPEPHLIEQVLGGAAGVRVAEQTPREAVADGADLRVCVQGRAGVVQVAGVCRKEI